MTPYSVLLGNSTHRKQVRGAGDQVGTDSTIPPDLHPLAPPSAIGKRHSFKFPRWIHGEDLSGVGYIFSRVSSAISLRFRTWSAEYTVLGVSEFSEVGEESTQGRVTPGVRRGLWKLDQRLKTVSRAGMGLEKVTILVPRALCP